MRGTPPGHQVGCWLVAWSVGWLQLVGVGASVAVVAESSIAQD